MAVERVTKRKETELAVSPSVLQFCVGVEPGQTGRPFVIATAENGG